MIKCIYKAHFKHQMRRSQTNKYIFNSPENVCTFSANMFYPLQVAYFVSVPDGDF